MHYLKFDVIIALVTSHKEQIAKGLIMKKLLILLIALSLSIFALTSCDILNNLLGGGGNEGGNENEGGGNNINPPAYDDTKCTEGLAFEADALGNYTVSGYTGTETTVYVPAQYEGKPVTSIKSNAFKNNITVVELYLPSSITEIAAKAFENTAFLYKIEFYTEPESLTIGSSGFSGCSSLEQFELPSTTVKVGSRAFGGCNKLTYKDGPCTYVGNWLTLCDLTATSATIKPGTLGVADNAFSGTSVMNISVPASVKHIGNSAFMRCTALTSVTATSSSSLETIGDEVFAECQNLASVQLPATLKSIGFKAFFKCPALASIAIPEACEAYSTPNNNIVIENATKTLIFGCHKLGVSIPTDGSVEYIGEYAFYENNSYVGATFYAGIKGIGDFAFAYAEKVSEITIPANSELESIGNGAFLNAFIAMMKFGENSKLREIGEMAFSGAGLKNFTLPASVETLGKECFKGNWTMVAFNFEEGSKLKAIPDYMLSGSSGIKELCIPESVTSIGTNAFFSLFSLVDVYIPASVTSIGANAFDYVETPGVTLMSPTIRCAAAEKPAGWNEKWIADDVLPNATVIWGYTGSN